MFEQCSPGVRLTPDSSAGPAEPSPFRTMRDRSLGQPRSLAECGSASAPNMIKSADRVAFRLSSGRLNSKAPHLRRVSRQCSRENAPRRTFLLRERIAIVVGVGPMSVSERRFNSELLEIRRPSRAERPLLRDGPFRPGARTVFRYRGPVCVRAGNGGASRFERRWGERTDHRDPAAADGRGSTGGAARCQQRGPGSAILGGSGGRWRPRLRCGRSGGLHEGRLSLRHRQFALDGVCTRESPEPLRWLPERAG
jgi:hypothetical protein